MLPSWCSEGVRTSRIMSDWPNFEMSSLASWGDVFFMV